MRERTHVEVWSTGKPPEMIRPAREFAAIVDSERLPGVVATVLEAGGQVIAALHDDELIGYASIVRPTPIRWMDRRLVRRWDDLEGLLELGALEVARPYRGRGLGARIATAIAEDLRLDEAVLFGIGVVHHWDLHWSSTTPLLHRRRLAATLRHAGMSPRTTADPEVSMHPANALFARIGPRVSPTLHAAFEERLLQPEKTC